MPALTPEQRSVIPNFWTLLDLSTGHLKPQDFKLLAEYRGPNSSGRDWDEGQSLYVTPLAHGWLISTSGATACPQIGELADESARVDREDRVAAMREEGFSDEFVAIYVFACENGVADIRFDADASYLPGFPAFDPVTGDRVEEEEEEQPLPLPGL